MNNPHACVMKRYTVNGPLITIDITSIRMPDIFQKAGEVVVFYYTIKGYPIFSHIAGYFGFPTRVKK